MSHPTNRTGVRVPEGRHKPKYTRPLGGMVGRGAGTGGVAGDEEIVSLDGVVVEDLPAGAQLDVKVFNGLPC